MSSLVEGVRALTEAAMGVGPRFKAALKKGYLDLDAYFENYRGADTNFLMRYNGDLFGYLMRLVHGRKVAYIRDTRRLLHGSAQFFLERSLRKNGIDTTWQKVKGRTGEGWRIVVKEKR